MRLALDTNRYRDFAAGDPATRAILERAETVYLPFVVLGELRAGFAVGRRGRENERSLTAFLATEGVRPLFAGDATPKVYGELYRQLRTAGKPIPTNDLWIAALVVENDLQLCSRDGHFDALPQIARV